VRPAGAQNIPVVAALVASGAEFLVTGDRKRLLSLGMPQIVTAADFLSRLRAFGSEK
jgi:predicted nucleic acid-binding protein